MEWVGLRCASPNRGYAPLHHPHLAQSEPRWVASPGIIECEVGQLRPTIRLVMVAGTRAIASRAARYSDEIVSGFVS